MVESGYARFYSVLARLTFATAEVEGHSVRSLLTTVN